MDKNLDGLQLKIEEAKAQLSEATRKAIDFVDWKGAILSMKTKKGYNLEQFQDLETETELLLCGLTNPEQFPKELQTRMGITKIEVDDLINELNELIFKKIRDALVRTQENQNTQSFEEKKDADILKSAQIEINPRKPEIQTMDEVISSSRDDMLSKVENPELISPTPSIPLQKLSGSFQSETVKTEYSLPSVGKDKNTSMVPEKPKVDPYREIPN